MALRLWSEISWCVPDEIQSATDTNGNILYPYVRIYRSTAETSGYDLIKTDVVISTNQHPKPFIVGELCRNISFNKDFNMEEFLQGLSYDGEGKKVLLTLGADEPMKVELFSIVDEKGGYRLCLDNKVIYNTVNYSGLLPGWHGLNFNIGNLILNTAELPIAYVAPELNTPDDNNEYLTSNSKNFDSRHPFIENQVISEINSQMNGNWINKWVDPTTDIRNKDHFFYIVKYVTADKNYESKFYLTRKSLTPKEQRLVNHLKGWLTPWITNCLTDDDIRAGIIFALENLNIKSPVTYFTIESLPQILESTLMAGSAIYTLMYKYLGIAFSDISYSDNGVSVTIDRGQKIQNAIDKAMQFYNQIIGVAKLNYISPGCSVASIPLSVSLGGRLSGNIMGAISNLFNALGR
jgi:hypothetical protein